MNTSVLTYLIQSRPPDAVILAGMDRQFTVSDIASQCDVLEGVLRREGVTLVALYADNGPSWVVADLVCQRMNLCLVPLPTFFSPLQQRAILDECGCRFLLTDNGQSLQALIEAPVTWQDDVTGLQLCRLKTGNGDAAIMPRGTEKITFTSGSTSDPKGVCLGNAQLMLQARTLVDVIGLESPRHLSLLPLSTLLENVAGVYAPLLAGGKVILPTLAELGYRGSRLADPQQLLATISRVAPETMILIPELLNLLVAAVKNGWQPPDSFRFIAVGGSKVGQELLQEAWSLDLPVYEGYGLSECASVVSLNTPQDNQAGSCGKVLPHLDVQVEEGELVVRGNAMLGYLNQPDSWYPQAIQSGDLGNCDDKGFLHLSGRRKNLLISSYGRNISPEWPESELLANSLLQDAVVFGDALPHCVALVSTRDPKTPDTRVRTWIDQVNARLPDYARIKAWHRLERPLGSLPGMLTANGRPRRDVIAGKFETQINTLYAGAGTAAVTQLPSEQEMLS